MAPRDTVLDFLRTRLRDDAPPLRLTFHDGASFDFSPNPTIAVTFHSPNPIGAMLRGNFSGLADAYVAGKISFEGRIEDVIKTGIALAERLGKRPAITGLARLTNLVFAPGSKQKDRDNIIHHYDVGNEFYRIWLDQRMIYSCAYFRTGDEDIDLAQRQKLDHICRKLLLKPGERLLDVGCGWGGLLEWAVKNYGVSGVGVTLSERQHGSMLDRFSRSGLTGRVDVRLQHYLDLEDEGFDKIVSVGMYEHVGLRRLPTYFAKMARLLRPGGAFLNHGIVATSPDGTPRGPPGGEFINRHVFPGGAVPTLPRVLSEIAQTGLDFADAEDLRPHYALTLQHWSRRIETGAEEAIAVAGPEIFRIWRVFLAGMAYAFDHRWLSVAQVLSFKPSTSGEVRRPWTRQYQYEADSASGRSGSVALAGKLDWT